MQSIYYFFFKSESPKSEIITIYVPLNTTVDF